MNQALTFLFSRLIFVHKLFIFDSVFYLFGAVKIDFINFSASSGVGYSDRFGKVISSPTNK